VAFPFYAWERDHAAPPSFRKALRWSGVLTLVSAWAVLVMMTAGMGGGLASAADLSLLMAAVSDTQFGRVWMVRILLAVAVLALIVKPRPARDWPMLALSGLLLVSVALTGHSALPGGVPGLLHQGADAVHLLAAGWWVGGLLALALTARALGGEAHHVLERFSGVGYGAVAAIVLTGLFKSLLLVQTLSGVDATAYGLTLLLKVALAAAMGLLALSNNRISRRLKAGADQALWLGRLQHSVTLEFALGMAVLAVVGALGALSPPISQ
jgi:putative copper resistance protein D